MSSLARCVICGEQIRSFVVADTVTTRPCGHEPPRVES